MKTLTCLFIASLSLIPATIASAQGNWVVWSQPQNSTYAIVPSYASPEPLTDVEIADDFEMHGTVQRIVVNGYDCFNCAPPDVAGAFVRFYAWTPAGPAALQSETFIPDDGSNLLYSPGYPATLDITLPKPFVAAGKHFISVQLTFNGPGSWYWWITNNDNPQGVMALTRNRLDPQAPWTALPSSLGPLNCDVPFLLWGDDGNPPPPGTDPCGQWSVINTPSPAGTEHAILRDVHAIATDDVWAVGEYTTDVLGPILTYSMALHWDGNAWTHIPSPNPAGCEVCAHVTFEAVDASNPDDVWAAGGKVVAGPDGFVGTHLFVARYNGSEWTVMDTPLTVGGSGANVRDIEIIAPDDIWFFGDFIDTSGGPGGSQPALAMHWNGASFTIVSTPYPAGGTPGWATEAGSALSPDDIWAVGGGSDGDYSASGYIIHWDGNSWTRVLGPAPGTFQRLYDVKAIATDDVWAVGDYFVVGQGYFPLFLHWDGSTWTQVESPGGGRSLVAFDSDNVYSGGAGIVLWDGTVWEQVEDFDSVIGPSVTGISAAGLCDMWAVGRQIIVGDLLNFSAHLQPGAVGEFSGGGNGDINGDGVVNLQDIAPFVELLTNGTFQTEGDINGDGVVNLLDVSPFVALLSGG